MHDLYQRFEHAVDGLADLTGYPYRDRSHAWLERLRVNLPELRTIEALQPTAQLGYLAPPSARATVEGGAEITDHTQGAAAIARECRASPERAAEPARAALAAAGERGDLRAFITLSDLAAIEAAAAGAAHRLRAGAALPLLGVPIAVKDLMSVAGFPQTNGSGGPTPAPATRDAAAVARLRAAGALVVGTTNLHELAYGITSENPHHGSVVNPRHPGYTPGGSSGGSAAAVAAGIVRLAIGTDTAGSIRIPASCCGVVGFKPTFDVVPRDGALPLGASLDHVGPIAADVADAALMYSVMAGQPARTVRPRPLAGLRVGIADHYFFDTLADDVAHSVHAAIDLMQRDGAILVPIALPGVEASAALQFVTVCAEATDLHTKRLREAPETLGADVRVRLEIGQFLPATWYARAQRARADLAAMFATVMREVDVLVTPTLRVAPPPSGARTARLGGRDVPLHTAVVALTMPFNLTGMPALTLPCGHGEHGLPIGVQIAGACGDDWRVLNVAARLEALLPPMR
ncbi:MAG: amidase [Burkholderiales bacterium]|nr:amidase [Burkholderiales bacterium]